MKTNYYKIDAQSNTGKQMQTLLNVCHSCEQAADDWCRKVGAVTYYSSPRVFTGGVECVCFGDRKPDPQEWRPYMTIEGEQYYVPACQTRLNLKTRKREVIAIEDYEPRQSATALRKAMKRERQRIALPTISMGTIYTILDAKLPNNKADGQTPTFFLDGDTFYVGIRFECSNADLQEVGQRTYQAHAQKVRKMAIYEDIKSKQ